MEKPTLHPLLISIILLSSFLAKAQLPYNCNYLPRIALAGDSWAQYMYDDGTHNATLSMYGHGDKGAISETFEMPIGCPGSPGPDDYAVSGSEAREWADEANYNYLQNLIDALNANPSIDYVLLSIGGNDILAARSGGGWYKNMDLDVPGSEQALFDTITAHTLYIINEIWNRANPNIKVIISSYDFPNFNVTGSFLGIDYCEQYACPKREDLSRDDNGNGQIDESELITDAEINAMMDLVEGIRKTLADSHPNILYDNGMGLMHYYYGYDDPLYPYIPPGSTPYPQGQSPYATGGDLDTPTDRDNFRGVSLCGFIGNFPADPIHLDAEGYTYKIKNQFDNIFFENFRGEPDETFWSVGAEDGYVDIIEETANGNGIRVGDDDSGWPSLDNEYRGILSFNTEPLPDNADILGASLYIIRSGENDNPFFHSDRSPVLDIKEGYFGDNSALEWTDGTAPADATDIGCFHGLANENKWAIRVDLEAVALDYINLTGTTQLRMYFDYADWSPEYINFYDGDGIPALLPPEVEARQNSTLYTHRIVKKKSSPQGIAIEESLETGSAIEKRDGYVYYEKLKDIDIDEHGDTLLYFTTMVAIEHPGLAKHMSDTYNAPGNGYAPFLDITYQVPLPVDLLAFEAEKVEEEMTLLYWETGAEVDLEGFYIEHSVDAKQWKTLAFLVAKATNASQGDTYSFLHKAPSNGENYYRLKMKDLDGTVEYSDIRSLRFEGNAGLQNVGPNPFDDYFKLEWAARGAATLQIQLVDMLGRVLVERSIIVREDEGSYCLTGLSGLPMGTYMLKVWNGKAWYMERLVKK